MPETFRRPLPAFYRHCRVLLLELGGRQADALAADLARLGYVGSAVLLDDDGDVRCLEATLGARA